MTKQSTAPRSTFSFIIELFRVNTVIKWLGYASATFTALFSFFKFKISALFSFFKPKNENTNEARPFDDNQKIAAQKIQQLWKKYKERTEISFADIVWMAHKSIALRNQSREKGLKEIKEGGFGDAYSLAIFFVPSEPLIAENDPDEIRLRKKLLDYKKYKKEDSYYTHDRMFPQDQDDKRRMGWDALQLHTFSRKETKYFPEKIKRSIERQMKKNIFHLIKNCITSYSKKDFNMFHLMKMDGATFPYDYGEEHSKTYPTGKCGSKRFSSKKILASFEEGLYVDSNEIDLPFPKIALGGKRAHAKMRDSRARSEYMPFRDYIAKKRNAEPNKATFAKKYNALLAREITHIYREIVLQIKRLRLSDIKYQTRLSYQDVELLINHQIKHARIQIDKAHIKIMEDIQKSFPSLSDDEKFKLFEQTKTSHPEIIQSNTLLTNYQHQSKELEGTIAEEIQKINRFRTHL